MAEQPEQKQGENKEENSGSGVFELVLNDSATPGGPEPPKGTTDPSIIISIDPNSPITPLNKDFRPLRGVVNPDANLPLTGKLKSEVKEKKEPYPDLFEHKYPSFSFFHPSHEQPTEIKVQGDDIASLKALAEKINKGDWYEAKSYVVNGQWKDLRDNPEPFVAFLTQFVGSMGKYSASFTQRLLLLREMRTNLVFSPFFNCQEKNYPIFYAALASNQGKVIDELIRDNHSDVTEYILHCAVYKNNVPMLDHLFGTVKHQRDLIRRALSIAVEHEKIQGFASLLQKLDLNLPEHHQIISDQVSRIALGNLPPRTKNKFQVLLLKKLQKAPFTSSDTNLAGQAPSPFKLVLDYFKSDAPADDYWDQVIPYVMQSPEEEKKNGMATEHKEESSYLKIPAKKERAGKLRCSQALAAAAQAPIEGEHSFFEKLVKYVREKIAIELNYHENFHIVGGIPEELERKPGVLYVVLGSSQVEVASAKAKQKIVMKDGAIIQAVTEIVGNQKGQDAIGNIISICGFVPDGFTKAKKELISYVTEELDYVIESSANNSGFHFLPDYATRLMNVKQQLEEELARDWDTAHRKRWAALTAAFAKMGSLHDRWHHRRAPAPSFHEFMLAYQEILQRCDALPELMQRKKWTKLGFYWGLPIMLAIPGICILGIPPVTDALMNLVNAPSLTTFITYNIFPVYTFLLTAYAVVRKYVEENKLLEDPLLSQAKALSAPG